MSRKLDSNWLSSLVSHMLTKTLGSISEDIVSWFKFRSRTSRKLVVVVEFDCNIQPKLNDVVQKMWE